MADATTAGTCRVVRGVMTRLAIGKRGADCVVAPVHLGSDGVRRVPLTWVAAVALPDLDDPAEVLAAALGWGEAVARFAGYASNIFPHPAPRPEVVRRADGAALYGPAELAAVARDYLAAGISRGDPAAFEVARLLVGLAADLAALGPVPPTESVAA